VAAFRRFGQVRTTVNATDPGKSTRLQTDGAFRISLNSMYLRLLLLLRWWALRLGGASAWVIPPLFALMISSLQVVPEEQALSRLSGARQGVRARRAAGDRATRSGR
jgi:protein-S-isoprenylcysteine O-methyltransferase Ste14